ncbi:hypothetical protein COOONC_24981 [Cooperia oncophora]
MNLYRATLEYGTAVFNPCAPHCCHSIAGVTFTGFVLMKPESSNDRSQRLCVTKLIHTIKAKEFYGALLEDKLALISVSCDNGICGRKDPQDSFDALVFVTVAVRFASICSLLTMIPAMITERVFASRYISDYEKLPRPLDLFSNKCAANM